jgi:hypothetical protein
MIQTEESNKYFFQQIQEDENQVSPEEPKGEENLEEEEDSKINVKQSDSKKKDQQKMDTSNRLNITHKRYTTYTMECKKQIIQEVKIKLIII